MTDDDDPRLRLSRKHRAQLTAVARAGGTDPDRLASAFFARSWDAVGVDKRLLDGSSLSDVVARAKGGKKPGGGK